MSVVDDLIAAHDAQPLALLRLLQAGAVAATWPPGWRLTVEGDADAGYQLVAQHREHAAEALPLSLEPVYFRANWLALLVRCWTAHAVAASPTAGGRGLARLAKKLAAVGGE
jgi:hypothetical protein